MKRSQFLQRLGVSFGLVLLFAGCRASEPTITRPSSESLQPVSSSLKIATEPAFAPFEFKQGDQLVGFSMDLMNAIATVENLQLKFESMPFDGIIPALQTGSVDAAISSITITPERAKSVSFSRPYFKAGLAIAVRANDTTIQGLDDLAGKRIAVQIGTTGAEKARKVPKAQVIIFDSAPLALQELSNGNVDAVINDAPVTLYAIKNGKLGGIKVVGRLLTEEFYGIATPRDAPSLEKLNQGLTTVIHNGTYAEIYKKWFGDQPPALPEPSEPAA